MNPFDDFDLDLVKITREVSAPRSMEAEVEQVVR